MVNIELKKEEGYSVTKMLGFTSLLCILLLAGRIYFTTRFAFAFLVWNLFLAWIPLYISKQIITLDNQSKSGVITGSLFFVWLLFFPNAPYVITDLFHLKPVVDVPLWFDLILIISFAWNALMIGFVSLLEIQRFLNRKFSQQLSWSVIISVLILSGFGVFLGRYERWNTWDIIFNPLALFIDIFGTILNPFSHPRTIGVTAMFSSFLIVSYVTLFVLIKSKKYGQ